MKKRVSIIIPCYNAQSWVKESIDSCLGQTYDPIEIIVVDDGSTDRSLEIVKGYGDRIRWTSHPNQGANPTRNKGFSLASGDYVLFLDADDYILPERVEKQVECFESASAENRDIDVVFSSVRSQKHFPDGSVVLGDTSDERYYVPGDDILEALLTSKRLAHTLSPMFTHRTIAQVGGWDETVSCSQDRDLLLTVALSGAQFEFLPGCYSVYRQYPNAHRVSARRGRIRAETSLKRAYKAESLLAKQAYQYEQPPEKYQKALAQALFRSAFLYSAHYSDQEYRHILSKIESLNPDYRSDFSFMAHPHTFFRRLEKIFGFKTACIFYRWIKRTASSLKAASAGFSNKVSVTS